MAMPEWKTLPTEGMVPQMRDRSALIPVHGSRGVINLHYVAESTSGSNFCALREMRRRSRRRSRWNVVTQFVASSSWLCALRMASANSSTADA